jgi:uncharacterized protein YfaS (alpha-2-macroglobulin family)
MKKYLLPFLFTSLLLANPTDKATKSKLVSIDDAFVLKSKEAVFDNTISYTHRPLLECEPQISVVYKVESKREIKVIPKDALRSGTHYSCKYKKATFDFTTEPLLVEDARYLASEKLLRLSFSDKIDKRSLREGLVLQKVDRLSTTNLKYSLLQSDGKEMILAINEPVKRSTIVLKITKKIKTLYGKTVEKVFEKRFHEDKEPPVVLDKEKEPMVIHDAPQMIALDTGGFALRLFFDDSFETKSQKYIEIEGIEHFTVNSDNYIYRSIRKKYGLSDKPYYYTDIISSEFKPNKSYTVRLKKGLSTYRELKEEKRYTLKTGDRAKGIIFEEDKTYVSNAGEFGFSSANLDSATLIVERLLDDNLRYFLNFQDADKSNIEPYSKEVLTKKLTLNNQKNEIVKQKFSFKSLDKKLPFGVYKITLRYGNVVKEKIEEKSFSKVIFLSDLGISVNLAKEQAFISVLSLSTAKPIEGATVEIYSITNDILGTVKTNSDGVAIIEKDDLLTKNLLNGESKGVVVRTKEDTNFLLLNSPVNGLYPSTIMDKRERFKAYLYFQSKIVRPAAKINALITIKDRNFISASKLPIKLILRDPNGDEVYSKVHHTDGYGLIDFNYQLGEAERTGRYRLMAKIGDEIIGRESLKVEAFMPPKIENHISTNRDIYRDSELIELNISSDYLFGSPSSGLEGSVKLNARAVEFHHKDYKNYGFSNAQLHRDNVQSYLNLEDSFTLDEKGKVSLLLFPKITQRVPSILEAMIGVTVMDDTQPVSNYKKIKIYPYKAMVGLSIDKSSFEKGQKLTGKAVLIDPLSGEVIKRKLYAVIKKINWQYDYSNGQYDWQKEIKTVGNFSLQSNEAFSYAVQENGDYLIEVHDYLGGHSSAVSFDVWWWSYSNISPKNDLRTVEIKFEEKLYKKGDTIEVTLKSPILEGEVFLTLESEKVELYRRMTLDKGVSKISIPIEVEMGRGLHLHAVAIRASDSPSKLIPFRATGYKFVKPNRDEHKIKIEINAPNITKSKRELSLNIKTDSVSKLLISVVDRGILQLVEQKKPELFDHFNEKAENRLSYYDFYDELMSFVVEGNLIDFGAGDMMSHKKKHLAPDLGKRIKPFMIWSGIVESKNSDKNITIDIPEFNGRASIVAIAINADGLGVAQKDITVKDDVMLKPSYPKYALVGDKIDVPLRVFNTTKAPKMVTLSSTLSDNLSFVLSEKNVTIAPNSSTLIRALLEAKKIGKGEIMLLAKYGNETITKSVELPIYSPYALSTHTFKGISNQSKTFTPPKEYADAKVMITLSNNLIGALRDDLNYLVQYPHGCAEQTSSKLSAMHYAKPFLQKDELLRDSENFIRQGVKKLQRMQNYYGEFNYWRGGNYVHPYASLYASQILLELKRDGAEIRDSFIRNIIKMLTAVSSASGDYDAKYTSSQRVYAGFILAEHKRLSESTANMLYEKGMYKGDLVSKLYMSAILKMQGKTKEATELYNGLNYGLSDYATKNYTGASGSFGSINRDMFLHFMIKTAYFGKDVNDLVVVQKEFSNLYSTQTKAVALKAISTYLGKPKSSKLDVNIKINGKNENYTESTTITLESVKSPTMTLTPNNSSMSYAIELIKHLPKEIKNEISPKSELSIAREFINEEGKNIDIQNLIQGEKIYSKVKISNNGRIDNVVVSQRVPACLSIVNNRIKNQKSKYKDINIDQEYKEIRDDRVLNFINLPKKTTFSSELNRTITLPNRGVIYTPFMVTSRGECQLPAVVTEAMYDTRINSYAKEAKAIVVYEANATTQKSPILKTPVVKKESLSFESQAKALVRSLYKKEMTSTNANDFVSFFHYPMEVYYRTKNASKEIILKDKENYFRDWKKRVYKNIKLDVISSKNDEVAKIKIVFDYRLDNGKKELKGVSRHLLTVKKIDGELLIGSIELAK